ncbi:MAG: universal stress protein [Magnetococcales bacterium]|nr:universal stress protein [Magnetococcales bacterium]
MHRIIAVVDLFSPECVVAEVAWATVRRHGGEMIFFAMFDHLSHVPDESHIASSSSERFVRIEAFLLERLKQHVASRGIHDVSCAILSGNPGEELNRIARDWGADLIMADRNTARVLHNGWVPFLSSLTPLPCKIHIVPPERKGRMSRVLHLLGMPW